MQRTVRMRSGFGVNCDEIATGIGKRRQIGIARRNHQMGIEECLGARTDRLHHLRAESDVGHKMPVHDVDMHPVGTGFQHGVDFFAQTGEIGGKDGRGDGDGAHM